MAEINSKIGRKTRDKVAPPPLVSSP